MGYAEDTDGDAFSREDLPCKSGGKPIWLNPEELLTAEQIACGCCGRVMKFLLQVYVPLETVELAYHRSLYVFICRDPKCTDKAGAVKVFRCQLPQENAFYPADPDAKGLKPRAQDAAPLPTECHVCGLHGPLKCSKSGVHYCSAEHQKVHWVKGHRKVAGKPPSIKVAQAQNATEKAMAKFLFKEFEICTEDEPEVRAENYLKEQALIKKYEAALQDPSTAQDMAEYTEKDLDDLAGNDNEVDEIFEKFQKRVGRAREQVLRMPTFNSGAQPLWTHSKQRLRPMDVPPCPQCGQARIFEFQVMPQLLFYMEEEWLDWGTIVVYSCPASCASKTKTSYTEEYAYCQPPFAPVEFDKR